MKVYIIILACMLTACAHAVHKTTLAEIREYDQAVTLAEKNGVDATLMHQHLVDMIVSYSKDPGEDPYQKAARDASNALQWSAAAQILQATPPVQVNQAPPMSPMEYRRAVTGR